MIKGANLKKANTIRPYGWMMRKNMILVVGANCILPQKMILPYKTIGAIACGLKGQKVVVALLDKKA